MKNLSRVINRFPKARVLVLGDVILDEYIWGKVDRISPEAPVPVVWADKRTHVPGGSANVANNIRAFAAEVCLVGLVGKDANADILRRSLSARGIAAQGLCVDEHRHTTVKTRIIAGHQQVVRVDWEHTNTLSQHLIRKIARFLKRRIDDFDAIIIEDYGKGVITIELLEYVIHLARSHGKIITVDPKQEHFQYYRGVSCITPNRKELENAIRDLKLKDTANRLQLSSDRLLTDAQIDTAARQIREYLGLDAILVTLGEHGMKLFEEKGRCTHIPTVAQQVFDVSGAGDTVISTFTLALACGATKLEAAHIANYAAGIVVGKVGTAVTDRKELMARIRS